MDKYVQHANSIQGWYNLDVKVLEIINSFQTFDSNILEIGIHHGKSFIPLACLLKNQEKAYALDVFEDQQHNVDNSGKGNKDIFIRNLIKVFEYEFILNRIVISKCDTTKSDLKFLPEDFRIISIDGCHTKEGTYHDLVNAARLINDKGCIIIDDYFHQHWPGVRSGTDKFLSEFNFLPIFIGYNKFIIVRTNFYETYRLLLSKVPNNFAEEYVKCSQIAGIWQKCI